MGFAALASAATAVGPTSLVVLKTIFDGVLLFGIVANTAVIVLVLIGGKMRRLAMNLLLVNLAVSNLLLLLYVVFIRTKYLFPMDDSPQTQIAHWPFPSWLCTAQLYFHSVLWLVTATTFVAIAVERWGIGTNCQNDC